MSLDLNIVVPEFEKGTESKALLAQLIAANNHDLVIEGGSDTQRLPDSSRVSASEIHNLLRQDYDWTGQYVTVSREGSTPIQYSAGKKSSRLRTKYLATPEELRDLLESNPESHTIHLRGDSENSELISATLDIIKPEHPVYIANKIGRALVLYDHTVYNRDSEYVGKVIRLFAENFGRNFNVAYFFDAVRPQKSKMGVNGLQPDEDLHANRESISQRTYDKFIKQLQKNGLEVRELKVLHHGTIEPKDGYYALTSNPFKEVLYVAARNV